MSKERDLEKILDNPELTEFRNRIREALESRPQGMTFEEMAEYTKAAELEFFRGVIRLNFPTHEKWDNMNLMDRATFRVGGLPLNEIADRFGVTGNPMGNDTAFNELGRQIYENGTDSDIG